MSSKSEVPKAFCVFEQNASTQALGLPLCQDIINDFCGDTDGVPNDPTIKGSCNNLGVACSSDGNDGGVCCDASPEPFPSTCGLESRNLQTVPPQSEEFDVEGVEMTLSGVSSLDSNTMKAWTNVTVTFIGDETEKSLIELSDGEYNYNLRLAQFYYESVGGKNEALVLNFTVEFEIESSIENPDVDEYVLGPFRTARKRNDYIDALKAADEGFNDVSDIAVTVV